MSLSSVVGARTLSALHFYDLTPAIRTQHILDLLKPFDGLYRFKWLDDCNGALRSFVIVVVVMFVFAFV